jgi:hypothetical protein
MSSGVQRHTLLEILLRYDLQHPSRLADAASTALCLLSVTLVASLRMRRLARTRQLLHGHGERALSRDNSFNISEARESAIPLAIAGMDLREFYGAYRADVPMRTTGRMVVPPTVAGLASVRTRGRHRRYPTMWSA